MDQLHQFVIFRLAGRQYAVALAAVRRATLMVETSPLPGAPEIVAGILDFHGQLVSVVDVRKRLGLPERADDWNSQLLIVQAGQRLLGMKVDAVSGVAALPDRQVAAAETVYPGVAGYVQGVASVDGELLVIHDLSRFLAPEEARQLDTALLECRQLATEGLHGGPA